MGNCCAGDNTQDPSAYMNTVKKLPVPDIVRRSTMKKTPAIIDVSKIDDYTSSVIGIEPEKS